MISRLKAALKAALIRLADRIIEGPACPACQHRMNIHDRIEGCLGHVEAAAAGMPGYWCPCERPPRRAKHTGGA